MSWGFPFAEEGIATGHATFETQAPEWEEWDREHVEACRLVAEDDGRVVGWAALSPVSDRCVYGGVAEVSVYVSEKAQGPVVDNRILHVSRRAARDRFSSRGLSVRIVPAPDGLFRVPLGPYSTQEEARRAARRHGGLVMGC